MLSLYKLEIFAIVVENGSFSRAAEQLYMTQSAISQHMQELEATLGTTLFKRGRRGVTLTESGEKLHRHTVDILRRVAEAESDVMNVAQIASGETHIGATPTIGMYLVPEWIRIFRSKYPNLTVSLRTDITDHIIADVLSHRLDFGIVEGELDDRRSPRLGVAVLEAIEWYVVVGQDHQWWDEKTRTIEQLNAMSFVTRHRDSRTRSWMDSIFRAQDVTPSITAEFDNPEAIKQSVISGHCVTLLPEYTVKRELDAGMVRLIPVTGTDMRRDLKLIWDQRLPFPPVAKAFLQTISPQYPVLNDLLA